MTLIRRSLIRSHLFLFGFALYLPLALYARSCCCVFWQIRFDHLIMHRNVYRIFAEEMNAFCMETKTTDSKFNATRNDGKFDKCEKTHTHFCRRQLIPVYRTHEGARPRTHTHMAWKWERKKDKQKLYCKSLFSHWIARVNIRLSRYVWH